jgi:hypothetical protein
MTAVLAQRLLSGWRKPLAAAALCAAAWSAHAQTWTVTNLNSTGCNDGDIEFAVNFSGVSSGTWYFDTTADAAGQRYMDEYFDDNFSDGARRWYLFDENSRGQQTQSFPLPANTPITVILTLRNAAETPVYRTTVILSRCDGGVMLSNQSSPIAAAGSARSEERRVGKECFSLCSSRGWGGH